VDDGAQETLREFRKAIEGSCARARLGNLRGAISDARGAASAFLPETANVCLFSESDRASQASPSKPVSQPTEHATLITPSRPTVISEPKTVAQSSEEADFSPALRPEPAVSADTGGLLEICGDLKPNSQKCALWHVESGCPAETAPREHHLITEALGPFRAAAAKATYAQRRAFLAQF
jgi:hypothetical protein